MRFKELSERDKKELTDALFKKFKYVPPEDIYSELSFNNTEVIPSGDKWSLSDNDEQLLEGWLNFGGL